ncbi:uncharacterized protein EI97DRAFT_435050 [Westerdykella ornata]|uniref:Uncharacterized protein n=1 Tax=Westerdykella ornata TaxID=318751 RepID=A0A6A6JEU7_WESOR|nr:uncharacterized protein EI97DRAFT_435050 [Westerdykella ornata]KAF2274508.1 hypothetical protein EI97DRAFT_435050 [Westerdykella ornata]
MIPAHFTLGSPLALMAHQALIFLIVSFLRPVRASFDLARCCVKAARDRGIMKRVEEALEEKQEPWAICKFGKSVEYPSETRWPSVTQTRAWCKAECDGYQRSETAQWLQPLATWIAPYIAFLLLCPVAEGEDDIDENTRKTEFRFTVLARFLNNKHVHSLWSFVTNVIGEYVLLLGDPASALWGAFSEILSDLRLAKRLGNKKSSWLADKAVWIVMLAGDTKFKPDLLWRGFAKSLPKDERTSDEAADIDNPAMAKTTSWRMLAKRVSAHTPSIERNGSPDSTGQDEIIKQSTAVHASTLTGASLQSSMEEELMRGVQLLVQGRINFTKGIFMPTILMLAVAASVFFDAYQKLGDKDTAHALAYGVWYSWLVTLGVAANCFATSTNVGVARKAFGKSIELSQRRVSLSERYVNRLAWENWLWEIENPDAEQTVTGPFQQNTAFWFKFLLGQLIGCVCVCFASGSAAVISWTTPTVGIGCRSFNFVLYGVGTTVAAIIQLCRQWAGRNHSGKARTSPLVFLTWSYWVVVVFNALVLVVGTIFHLSGVYRSCWCSRLFAKEDTLLEFNRNTEQAYTNARRYWLVTGYVAFSFVWIICSFAVSARKYIIWRVERALEARD